MSVWPVDEIRARFPILARTVNGCPLVYLDNAATTQKPDVVLEAEAHYYRHLNANIHRGVHQLSQEATAAYEEARGEMAHFLNASGPQEIIFTRGTTESINLVAAAFGARYVREGDEIVVSAMEHHSNIVPWQMLCEQRGAQLRVIPISDAGELDLEAYAGLLTDRTRLVAVTHISNALGTINPVKAMIATAHAREIPVLLDGAQSVPHLPVDVADLDCDFLAFSGHKIYGPTGIGVLYGKTRWLEEMPPWQGGGDMIASVRWEKTIYNTLPYKFEAGTPNIAGAIGLGAAIGFVSGLGLAAAAEWEDHLLQQATQALQEVPGLRLVGTAPHKAAIVSFVMDCAHPHDIGTVLDQAGVAIRTGHHCTQPLMERLGIPATARASMAFTNTSAEVETLVRALHQVNRLFG